MLIFSWIRHILGLVEGQVQENPQLFNIDRPKKTNARTITYGKRNETSLRSLLDIHLGKPLYPYLT